MATQPKTPRLTIKEINLTAAREMLGNLQSTEDVYVQAEMANLLKVRFRLTRLEIAGFLNLTASEVLTRFKQFDEGRAKGLIPTGKVANPPLGDNTREALIKDEQERITRKLVTDDTKAIVERDILLELLAEKIAAVVPAPSHFREIEKLHRQLRSKVRSKRPEEAVVSLMSDLHYDLVNEFFNPQIADEVVDRFVTKTLRLTELHRTQCPVRRIFFCPIGDNLQGSSGNFPAQRWTTYYTAADQGEHLTQVLIRMIDRFLIEYDIVDVVPRRGNHGNLYSSKSSVEPDHANIEAIVHRSLAYIYRNNPRVIFHLNEEQWYTIVPIMGIKALFTHGHDLAGTSFDSIINSYRKFDDILPRYDVAFQGHIHRTARLPLPMPFGSSKPRTIYTNGTAVRGDVHGEKFGAAHSNLWWNVFVDQEHGVTAEYAVDLYGQ